MGEAGAGLVITAVLIGIVIMIMWIVLPFAIFGIKPLMHKLIAEVQKTNELLKHRPPGE